MSFKIEIKFDKKRLEKIFNSKNVTQKLNSQKSAKEIGPIVVDKMKKLIASGQSPITGWPQRFEQYKESYKKRILAKTYKKFSKRVTPVNLKLSGDFLKGLKSRFELDQNGYSAIVFYTEKESPKEEGHRKGKNSQKKRPTIPIKNEEFRSAIVTLIKQIYVKNFKLE